MPLTHEIPLQHNMFTGTLTDNRTGDQKERDKEQAKPVQTLMFSQRDILQIGVSPTPRMDLSPGRLALISEDPRTPEEIERDLVRQAQALTPTLFAVEDVVPPVSQPDRPLFPAGAVVFPADKTHETDDDLTDEDEEAPLSKPPPAPLTKFTAYVELVRLAEEEAITLKHSLETKQAAVTCMSLAQFEAKRAGLTDYEMTTALMIGEFRGKAQVRAAASVTSPSLAPVTPEKPQDAIPLPVTPLSPEVAERALSDDAIPILWMNRDDLITRRPDLTPVIQTLNDDELDFIAEKVGDALEEFYWIQLNVVLSLFLDHDLALHLRIPKKPTPTPLSLIDTLL
jgi:hypothetical protein